MSQRSQDRRIIRTKSVEFEPYDFEGPLQADMSFLPLSYDRRSHLGSYLIRMAAGAETVRHTHRHQEEFIILEGDLIEDDGTVLGPGDHVCYAAGTTHNSRTDAGCLLIGFDWPGDQGAAQSEDTSS